MLLVLQLNFFVLVFFLGEDVACPDSETGGGVPGPPGSGCPCPPARDPGRPRLC